MILRALALVGGLMVGAGTAQFPEFSQQYLQRLGGAVDALSEVVADFDASATALGLSREEALLQMQGSAFVERRRVDMQRTFARYEGLQKDLTQLRGEGPFMRAYRLPHMGDREIIRATWAVYQPALPLTGAGLVFGGLGVLFGGLLGGALLRLLVWPFRRVMAA